MKLSYTETGKTSVEAGLGAKGNQEFHFGHVKSGMLRSIQTEMQSSRHIVESGVQGSRVGRLAGERGVVGRALGRGRESEM